MLPSEVFLSHSSRDEAVATDLAEALVRHGIPVWYSRRSLQGAQQWHDEIGAALCRCDWFVVLLSPAAVESMWVKRELIFALRQNRFADRIVPVRYQPCDVDKLSWVLGGLQIVEIGAGFEEGCRSLLRLWGVGYRPPAT